MAESPQSRAIKMSLGHLQQCKKILVEAGFSSNMNIGQIQCASLEVLRKDQWLWHSYCRGWKDRATVIEKVVLSSGSVGQPDIPYEQPRAETSEIPDTGTQPKPSDTGFLEQSLKSWLAIRNRPIASQLVIAPLQRRETCPLQAEIHEPQQPSDGATTTKVPISLMRIIDLVGTIETATEILSAMGSMQYLDYNDIKDAPTVDLRKDQWLRTAYDRGWKECTSNTVEVLKSSLPDNQPTDPLGRPLKIPDTGTQPKPGSSYSGKREQEEHNVNMSLLYYGLAENSLCKKWHKKVIVETK